MKFYNENGKFGLQSTYIYNPTNWNGLNVDFGLLSFYFHLLCHTAVLMKLTYYAYNYAC